MITLRSMSPLPSRPPKCHSSFDRTPRTSRGKQQHSPTITITIRIATVPTTTTAREPEGGWCGGGGWPQPLCWE